MAEFFRGLWSSLTHEFQSRKFRALLVALLAVLSGYLSGQMAVQQAVAAAITALAVYIGAIAVEDGLTNHQQG